MFKKLFTKKGSAEIVSIVLAIVIIGGLAVAIIGNLSTNIKTFYEKGLDKQNRDVETVYTDVFDDINVVPPNLGRPPNKPTVTVNKTRTVKDGKFLVTLTPYATDPDGDSVTYEWEGKSSDDYYAVGTHTVKVRAKDVHNTYSDWTIVTFEVVNNPPNTPVITRTPSGTNVSPNDYVTITANATDPDGDPVTYVWSGRLAETSKYPLGKHVITVKAVDSAGAESQPAAIVFFVVDPHSGGGMMLTDPESRIYEDGIEGATIVKYTFNVPSVEGHSGNDYAWVKGYNRNTGQWEEIEYRTTKNGIYMEGTLPKGVYTKLEFFYYASHCMYGKSNITYTVEYSFD